MYQRLMAALIITAVLAAFLATASAQPARTTADLPLSEVHNREILVELDPSRGAKSVSAFCAATGLVHQRTRPLSYATYEVVRVPADQDYHAVLAALEADPRVATVGPNVIKRVSETVLNDPLLLNTATSVAEGLTEPHALNNQWALLLTRCPEAWDYSTGRQEVIVAVLDTGVNFDHEDLQGAFWTNTGETPDNSVDDDLNGYVDDYLGYDFHHNEGAGRDTDPTDPTSEYISHGNATTSIVAARGDNALGLAGVAGGNGSGTGVRVMALRVGTNTDITVDAEIDAIDYAIANGANIISMSFGGASGGPPEENAINRAWDEGLYIVAASGNVGQGNQSGGEDLIDLPAGFDNCVAIGASSIFPSQGLTGSTPVVDENIANYSKTGPETEIVAPGTHILCAGRQSATYSNLAHQFTGTSAATPLVAGLAALLWSLDIEVNGTITKTNADIRGYIRDTAVDLGFTTDEQGHGRIDALAAARQIIPNPPPEHGDANGDEIVDEADLTIVVGLDGVSSGSASYNEGADYDSNGVINNQDVLAIITRIAGQADGDTDDDGDVDMDDVEVLRQLFGVAAGDAAYDAVADADRNGVIDELDLFVVGRNFGS